MQTPQLPRAISYVSGGKRVHGTWTKGWSSPVHCLDGVPYGYWQTRSTGEAVVDIFVAL